MPPANSGTGATMTRPERVASILAPIVLRVVAVVIGLFLLADQLLGPADTNGTVRSLLAHSRGLGELAGAGIALFVYAVGRSSLSRHSTARAFVVVVLLATAGALAAATVDFGVGLLGGQSTWLRYFATLDNLAGASPSTLLVFVVASALGAGVRIGVGFALLYVGFGLRRVTPSV